MTKPLDPTPRVPPPPFRMLRVRPRVAPSLRAEPAPGITEPPDAQATNQNIFSFTDVNQVNVYRVRLLIEALKDPHILARFNNEDVKTLSNEFTSLGKYFETQLQLRTAIASVAFAADPTQQRQTPSSTTTASVPVGGSSRSAPDFMPDQFGRQSFPTPPPQTQYGQQPVLRGLQQAQTGAPRAFATPQPSQMSTAATLTPQNMQVRQQLAFNTPQATRGGAGGRPNPDALSFVPGVAPSFGEAQFRMPGAAGPIGSGPAPPFGRLQPGVPAVASVGVPPTPLQHPNAAMGRQHEMLSQLFPNASPNAKGDLRFNQQPAIVPPGFTGAVGPLSGPKATGPRGGLQPAVGASNESTWPVDAAQQAAFGRSVSANCLPAVFPPGLFPTGAAPAPNTGSLLAAVGGGPVAGGAPRGMPPPPTLMPPEQATSGESLITATAAIPTSAGTTGTPGPPQQFTVSIMAQPTIFRVGGGPNEPRYSRKVFVGGLPPDVDERMLICLRILFLELIRILIPFCTF